MIILSCLSVARSSSSISSALFAIMSEHVLCGLLLCGIVMFIVGLNTGVAHQRSLDVEEIASAAKSCDPIEIRMPIDPSWIKGRSGASPDLVGANGVPGADYVQPPGFDGPRGVDIEPTALPKDTNEYTTKLTPLATLRQIANDKKPKPRDFLMEAFVAFDKRVNEVVHKGGRLISHCVDDRAPMDVFLATLKRQGWHISKLVWSDGALVEWPDCFSFALEAFDALDPMSRK